MIWMILIAAAALMLIIGFSLPSFYENYSEKISLAPYKRGLKLVAFPLIAVSVLLSGLYVIPAGHRGVQLTFGAVTGVLNEGVNYVVPFVQKVEVIEVRTQKEQAEAAAASKDLQNVSTTVAINYHLNPSQVGMLFKSVGLDYAKRIIDPATQETVKSVVANYTAEELIRLRSKVKLQIDEMLTERLSSYNIVVEPNGVSPTNFQFSEEFNAAIESKQVAQQAAEKSKYELQKAEIDAKTAIAKAEGEAKSNTIKARALNQSGGGKVLAREWIEKWDGHLPQIMSGNSNMMFDVSEIMKSAQTETQ